MDNLKPPIPKQLVNEKAIKIYAAFLAALTIIIIADRWLNRCNWKTHSAASHTTLRAAYVKLTQYDEGPSFRDFCLLLTTA
jgi:hypothetical protein